jgi:hypothetical protein
MLAFLFAALTSASTPAYTAAELAAYRGQIKSSCDLSLKQPGVKVPAGFCACFAKATAEPGMGLTAQQRAVFLLLTENAGDPVGAQRAAQSRLNMTVEAYASVWDKLNPIGQKAGSDCAKAR